MPVGLCLYGQHFGTELLLHPLDVLLVLLGVKGAGAVDHESAFAQAMPCIADDVALQLPALLNIRRTPFANGGLVLTEHAFARTGHIAEHHIEQQLRLAIVARIVISDDTARPVPLCNVLSKDARPLRVRFV